MHGLAMSRYQDRIGTHSPEAGGSPTFGGTGGSWPRYLGGTHEGASFAFWLPEQHSTPYPRGPWFQLIRLGPALSRRSASLSTKPRLVSDRANGTVSRRTSFTTSSQKGNWLRPCSRGQGNRAAARKPKGSKCGILAMIDNHTIFSPDALLCGPECDRMWALYGCRFLAVSLS